DVSFQKYARPRARNLRHRSRQPTGDRDVDRGVEAPEPEPRGRASPDLPARAAADLSLLLRSSPRSTGLELLFRTGALRQGRLRDPGAAKGLPTAELPTKHALLDAAIRVLQARLAWPARRPLSREPVRGSIPPCPCCASTPACSACSARRGRSAGCLRSPTWRSPQPGSPSLCCSAASSTPWPTCRAPGARSTGQG